jgi:hypothetical protein
MVSRNVAMSKPGFGRFSARCFLVAACGLCFAVNSHAAANEDYNQMKKECNFEAGGKTAEMQKPAMRECSQNRTDEMKASGSEDAQHAKIKACDAESKGVAKEKREKFQKECYARQR